MSLMHKEHKLAYMSREQAKEWFLRQNKDVMAGTDEAAKRKAWAACIFQLMQEDAVDPKKGKYWQYPY